MKCFFIALLLVPLNICSQEVDASDILFLKIQELEGELASLRSELESQAYLIEKLSNEELSLEENNIPQEADSDSEESSFRFEGINDSRSIDEVYDEAISELNDISVFLNKHWVEADFRITTGFVEPNFFAGFSGGSKLVAPGLAGLKTIMKLHNFERLSNPYSIWGEVDRNPIQQDVRK